MVDIDGIRDPFEFPELRKDLILVMMLTKFPDMINYLDKLTWYPKHEADYYNMDRSIPLQLRIDVDKWFMTVLRKYGFV